MTMTQEPVAPESPPQNNSGDASHGQCQSINVPTGERIGSAMAGSALVLAGLRRRSLSGVVVSLIGAALIRRGVTGHCPAYAALGVHRVPGPGAEPEEYSSRGVHVVHTTTISKSPNEIYKFWRNFENLPKVMYYLEKVKILDERRSQWTTKAPGGLTVQWEAEIINDVPGELIAWRSLYPATVDNAGSVRFAAAPDGRGTEVTVSLEYVPPGGNIGWAITKLFGKDPSAQVREDLRRLKSIMEAGEAPTIKGQSHGARGLVGTLLATD